jgi:hypothetical protein
MNYEDDYEKRGFLQKYGFVLGIGAIGIVVGSLVIGQISKGNTAAPHRMPEVVMIRPLPPPPPPPPEPPKEIIQKMIEQEPINQQEDKPDEHPKDQAPAAVTTNITGPGNDAFGLGGPGSGGLLGGGGSGGHHSRFGWYAGEVQKTVQDALNRNSVTSRAEFARRVRIWADVSGRVVRVKLDKAGEDPEISKAIDEALNGLQLPDPPPRDMPMPIVMRLEAHRPS